MSNSPKKSNAEEIIEAVRNVRATAAEAHNAALTLNSKILDGLPDFASEAALIRDSASLLQHLVQTFDRRSKLSLGVIRATKAQAQ